MAASKKAYTEIAEAANAVIHRGSRRGCIKGTIGLRFPFQHRLVSMAITPRLHQRPLTMQGSLSCNSVIRIGQSPIA